MSQPLDQNKRSVIETIHNDPLRDSFNIQHPNIPMTGEKQERQIVPTIVISETSIPPPEPN